MPMSPASEGDRDRVLAMISGDLRDVKDSINHLARDMNSQMARLVSQREFDHTRDAMTLDIGELRARIDSGFVKHDADIKGCQESMKAQIKAIEASIEEGESRRRAFGWRVFGGFLAFASLAVAAIGLALSQIH